MKPSIYILAALLSIGLWSCSEKDDLSPVDIPDDYTLPQGDASQQDNDRIQALYDKYGSYFLYNVSQKDYQWTPSAGTGAAGQDSIVLGDPQYTGKMLDFLDGVWLKYLSEDFKKGPGIPYRVIMVDTIKTQRSGRYIYDQIKVKGKALAFAGMNTSVENITPELLEKGRNTLLPTIIKYYTDNQIVKIPQAFYDLTDYKTLPLPEGETLTSSPENLDIFRNRGFIQNPFVSNGVVLSRNDWYFGDYSWSQARVMDPTSYLAQLVLSTDEQLEEYAPYPLIQQKFQLLIDAFNEAGIDVRAIANEYK